MFLCDRKPFPLAGGSRGPRKRTNPWVIESESQFKMSVFPFPLPRCAPHLSVFCLSTVKVTISLDPRLRNFHFRQSGSVQQHFWTQSSPPISRMRHTCNPLFPSCPPLHPPSPPRASPSRRTCFLLSLLNASPWEMDGGASVLLRWKFLRSYGYDLVGRSGSIFAGRLTVCAVLAAQASKHFKAGRCTESR